MQTINLEIWSDSFHEGDWCCANIAGIFRSLGWAVSSGYVNGFQPCYTICTQHYQLNLLVYGSYRSWSPLPSKIRDILEWGKPDFIAYDALKDMVLFAVEETAATATGNQTAQRCERQYGSLRFGVPYWYLVSEYGMHIDGGARRDSIWPVIAALKLSIRLRTPCVVVHYSDIDNLEDYQAGKGLHMLFTSLCTMLNSYCLGYPVLNYMKQLLTEQYQDMLHFLLSQWGRNVDFLPSLDMIRSPHTAGLIADCALNLPPPLLSPLADFLHWPLFSGLPRQIQDLQSAKALLKYDRLCALMEQDVSNSKAYTLSSNAGSGKPRTTAEVSSYIEGARRKFSTDGLVPPAEFDMDIADFPYTNDRCTHHHMTTAKNIVYLYDRWADFKDSVQNAYPRLKEKLDMIDDNTPVFVYVSNSVKPGRVFGDPYTGQLAAYATAFGKFDASPRAVVAYFPHQVHNQISDRRTKASNKGMTLMKELTDLIIFHGGVGVNLQRGEFY